MEILRGKKNQGRSEQDCRWEEGVLCETSSDDKKRPFNEWLN
jgi:hypothetical protein